MFRRFYVEVQHPICGQDIIQELNDSISVGTLDLHLSQPMGYNFEGTTTTGSQR